MLLAGGLMSIFLMGVYDPKTDKWCTVSKCGSGFDDKTLDKLQKDFDMIKISKVCSSVCFENYHCVGYEIFLGHF